MQKQDALPAMRDLDAEESAFVSNIIAQIGVETSFNFKNEDKRFLSRPRVLAAIHQAVQKALVSDAPVSLSVLKELRDSSETPARTRADIAIKMLTMAGVGVAPGKNHSDDKPLSEMTSSQLAAYVERNEAEIHRLEAELAARAKPVSAPTPAPKRSKPLKYLD